MWISACHRLVFWRVCRVPLEPSALWISACHSLIFWRVCRVPLEPSAMWISACHRLVFRHTCQVPLEPSAMWISACPSLVLRHVCQVAEGLVQCESPVAIVWTDVYHQSFSCWQMQTMWNLLINIWWLRRSRFRQKRIRTELNMCFLSEAWF